MHNAQFLKHTRTPLKELRSHARQRPTSALWAEDMGKPPSRKGESQDFCVERSIIYCNTLRILCCFAPLREALGFFHWSHTRHYALCIKNSLYHVIVLRRPASTEYCTCQPSTRRAFSLDKYCWPISWLASFNTIG